MTDFKEATEILDTIRKKYYDSTHVCYAINLINSARSSDDGEPSKTAGVPILEVLKKANLNNTMCVVIRYFGGIKLGAGGLIRAYSKSASEAINNSIFKETKKLSHYKIKINYDFFGNMQKYIRDNSYEIKDIIYDELITFDSLFDKEEDQLKKEILDITKGSAEMEKLDDEEIFVILNEQNKEG